MSIALRLREIQIKIEKACKRSDRNPSDVRLIGVSKTKSAMQIEEAYLAGLREVGENYIQEAIPKKKELEDKSLKWHFIGSLQRNKAKYAVKNFDYIHTVDRLELAFELDKVCRRIGHKQKILMQINLGDESTKSGVSLEGAYSLFQGLLQFENLELCGFMALPPFEEDKEKSRVHFKKLKQFGDKCIKEAGFQSINKVEYSMGMSHDYEVAIEEGATMVRVGTALFGART